MHQSRRSAVFIFSGYILALAKDQRSFIPAESPTQGVALIRSTTLEANDAIERSRRRRKGEGTVNWSRPLRRLGSYTFLVP